MAYASKYYDPVKRHEYYLKHRQLKGRTNRGSTASLNEDGKAAAAEVKEQLQAELKATLAKLPRGATEQRKKLREEYNEKYYAELEKMRQDPSLSKTARSTSGSSGSRTSSGISLRTRSSSSGSNKTSEASTAAQKKTKEKSRAELATDALNTVQGLISAKSKLSEEQQAQIQAKVDKLIDKAAKKLTKDLKAKGNSKVSKKKMGAKAITQTINTINRLQSKLESLPEETQAKFKQQIQSVIDRLSKRLGISSGSIEDTGTEWK